LQDRRSALTSQLALVQKTSEQLKEDVAENTTDPKTTLAWSQLVSRKADLESQLTRMLTELRPKHPDVLAKQAEVDSVNAAMEQMIGEWKERIREKQDKLRNRPDLTVGALEVELQLVDGEIKRQQAVLGQIDSQVATVMQRINNVPGAEVTLGALERDYQTKKAAYDQLLMQAQKIGLGADAASQQQGEGIQVVDPANLPALPVAPKRLMLVGLGIAAGFAFGLLLAGLFEVPRLLTIQTSEDATHYTSLPVLMTVPELLTPAEALRVPRRRKMFLAFGFAAMVLAIPALALILKLTQVFERFAV
jgi:polysaccharide biosynthesis transport protein